MVKQCKSEADVVNFQDLPSEVQVIAAQLLSERFEPSNKVVIAEKPAKELAQEIRDVFIELYSPS